MKRILIVDDAVTVRMYHRQLMEACGFAADEAENGIEALEKALSAPPDLFLIDVNMRKMDGYRLLREIRSNPVLQATPAIVITTEAETRDQEQAYRAGANLYLAKPVDPVMLRQVVALMAAAPEPAAELPV